MTQNYGIINIEFLKSYDEEPIVPPPTYEDPAYTNVGGTGDRTELVTVLHNFTGSGEILNSPFALVDGSMSDVVWIPQVDPTGIYIDFLFDHKVLITEMKFYQSAVSTHGLWQCQIDVENGGTFTNVGGSFTLGSDSELIQIINEWNTNSTPALRYRMVGLSGMTNSINWGTIREVEFKIANPI
jgi:hypothetical protein